MVLCEERLERVTVVVGNVLRWLVGEVFFACDVVCDVWIVLQKSCRRFWRPWCVGKVVLDWVVRWMRLGACFGGELVLVYQYYGCFLTY